MLGNFINAVLNFLIMSFAVFCMVRRSTASTARRRPLPRRLPSLPGKNSCLRKFGIF